MSASPKVAIVTGAGTGIGKAVALAFLKNGYRVALAGRRSEPLQQAIAEGARGALAVPTDVSDPASVAKLFAQTREAMAASMYRSTMRASAHRARTWRAHVRAGRTSWTSISPASSCIQEAFRIMKDQNPRGGRIINNGSIRLTRRGRLGLHGDQARGHRPYEVGLARRPVRHCLRADRHRQRAHGDGRAHGGRRAAG
jgi:NAD(P)-dependent dehydrogenase (short-subunit alcohol dehydrogenase family)